MQAARTIHDVILSGARKRVVEGSAFSLGQETI